MVAPWPIIDFLLYTLPHVTLPYWLRFIEKTEQPWCEIQCLEKQANLIANIKKDYSTHVLK